MSNGEAADVHWTCTGHAHAFLTGKWSETDDQHCSFKTLLSAGCPQDRRERQI